MGVPFAATFMRIYDKKIASGEITYRELKMDINDFNQLCIVPGYILAREETERLCDKMKLTEEEREALLQYYE